MEKANQAKTKANDESKVNDHSNTTKDETNVNETKTKEEPKANKDVNTTEEIKKRDEPKATEEPKAMESLIDMIVKEKLLEFECVRDESFSDYIVELFQKKKSRDELIKILGVALDEVTEVFVDSVLDEIAFQSSTTFLSKHGDEDDYDNDLEEFRRESGQKTSTNFIPVENYPVDEYEYEDFPESQNDNSLNQHFNNLSINHQVPYFNPYKEAQICKYWPQCNYGSQCFYQHPLVCQEYYNCQNGYGCQVHPPLQCPFGFDCDDGFCPQSHPNDPGKQQPYYPQQSYHHQQQTTQHPSYYSQQPYYPQHSYPQQTSQAHGSPNQKWVNQSQNQTKK